MGEGVYRVAVVPGPSVNLKYVFVVSRVCSQLKGTYPNSLPFWCPSENKQDQSYMFCL